MCNDLLKSYFSNRTQCINFQQTVSDMCPIKYGVPQRFGQGPLFLIHINDIVNFSKLALLVFFPADTNIIYLLQEQIKTMLTKMLINL